MLFISSGPVGIDRHDGPSLFQKNLQVKNCSKLEVKMPRSREYPCFSGSATMIIEQAPSVTTVRFDRHIGDGRRIEAWDLTDEAIVLKTNGRYSLHFGHTYHFNCWFDVIRLQSPECPQGAWIVQHY